MNEHLGKEPTTNPPIIIAPIADAPIFKSVRSSMEPSTPSPVPSSDGMDDTDSSFNTGKKVKQKKNNVVANEVLDVMSDHLAFKSQEMEERRKEREERKKARDERRAAQSKVDEAIIKSQESQAKMMDSVTMFMEHMMNKE